MNGRPRARQLFVTVEVLEWSAITQQNADLATSAESKDEFGLLLAS